MNMNCHQTLTGAANSGDNCYSVGSVEGISFTAYTSGCNIVILASDLTRVQIIPGILYGNIQVNCIDSATDVGKIAAAYSNRISVLEPTPLLQQVSAHKLDYKWIQTACLESNSYVSVISFNLEGNKLLTGGEYIQMWHLDNTESKHNKDDFESSKMKWWCVWQCKTSTPVFFLRFSPDGTLFTSAGKADRLVKIWFESAAKVNYVNYMSGKLSENNQNDQQNNAVSEVNYSFIYIAHPRALTGISWRKMSKYLPRGSVANMLVTSCRDNICRIWVQTLLPEDGLVNFTQIEGLSNHVIPRSHTQRHRQKLMQRLKHMKSFSQFKKRQAVTIDETNISSESIPNLPSTYSVHDFHSFGIHGTAVVPGLHFHLTASINAETDIPLVPSLAVSESPIASDINVKPSFVIHWLNNKEMSFTQSAEKILHQISVKIHNSDSAAVHSDIGSDTGECEETDETDGASSITVENNKKIHSKTPAKKNVKHLNKAQSHDDIDVEESRHQSRQSFHTTSSSTSLATEINVANFVSNSHFGELLDRRLEALMREWHTSSDLLFGIHPLDGSLLVWLIEWLDESSPGSFRQAQVSFSSRIPNAIPLGDAATMSHNISLYSPTSYLDLKSLFLTSSLSFNSDIQTKINTNSSAIKGLSQQMPTPSVCMITKHNNGSLNLWNIGFGEGLQFTQLLSISHSARICGHRFRVNDITCHPVLPLLLTTSHHNIPGKNIPYYDETSIPVNAAVSPIVNSCCQQQQQGVPNTGFCSELILWKVDSVGPLSKSGGITELARINSPETTAFANVAWIPTLLPSTTLGAISNSPSACFVASDGHQLRIYQAIIDARSLLSEIYSANRKHNNAEFSPTVSDDSTSSEAGVYRHAIKEAFKIVSLQSTARPGCILELSAISDAIHDWQNTQLLHVFQEQLIKGSSSMNINFWKEKEKNSTSLLEASLGPVVDLRHSHVFEEPFYLVVMEKNGTGQSILHMWRLVIASQSQTDSHKLSYVPDSHLIQESDHSNATSRSNSPDLHDRNYHKNLSEKLNQTFSVMCPIKITTAKVCTQQLLLDNEVDVIHATPAAGHLSSSNIYPACFAPYLICTACSDGLIRFWKCSNENFTDNNNKMCVNFKWVEWEMIFNKLSSSAFEVPGLPLYVSCAYSGRVACAYKYGQSFTRSNSSNPNSRFINIALAIIECESTGGSEWVLEDTIHLKNIPIPQTEYNLGIDFAPLVDTSLRNRKTVDKLVMRLSSAYDEHSSEHRGANNISRLLSVPSYTTMQSLKQIISEQGNQFTLSQKSLVQLDWVSTEDGSHVLTVSAGSKITLFTPVSTDIAQANLQAMKASEKTITTPSNRLLLKQASSMAATHAKADEIRWMTLRTTNLVTADGLPPLPMQLTWVRDGILVIGMDNEMLIYTQWKSETQSNLEESSIEITESRVLTEEDLLSRAQESSQLRLPQHPGSIPRTPSLNVLHIDHRKPHNQNNASQQKTQNQEPKMSVFSQLPDFGLFEASRLACPVLPQYHPKQLMELLAFGKIQRVRAILSHLVACLCSMDSLSGYFQYPQHMQQSVDRTSESERSPKSWLRSRTLSVAAPSSSPAQQSPLESDNFQFETEEVQLDYTEITSVRPMPLYALIEADGGNEKDKDSTLEQELDNLFDSNFKSQVEETLDEILGRSTFNFNAKSKKKFHYNEKNFGQRQARILTKILTHSHLPGLSSLDQMHLLALADSVVSFANPTANKSSNNHVTDDSDGIDKNEAMVSTDSLDDCGLRFLLAMRQHIYLLRCLPLVQRKNLQKEGLGSHNIIWAFHSETQEELVQLIPSFQRGNVTWSELRELGIGFWIRNNVLLRKVIEKLAMDTFKANKDPLDAALFYLSMKKKSLIWGLFRSVQDKKMTTFFQNNFNDDKWRKAALKNAYALMGKQRFEHAAAFFLLAGSVWDAVEVCLSKLNDLQLAMVVIRLYEGDIETVPQTLKRLLYQEVLGKNRDGYDYKPSLAHPDPFWRSMAYWMLQDYNNALTTLLEADIGSAHSKYCGNDGDLTGSRVNPSASVFNFYLYIRTQPLIVRRQFAQSIKQRKEPNMGTTQLIYDSSFSSNSITAFERRLYFLTAHAHFRAGCPSLALEVLSRLPNRILLNDQNRQNSMPDFDESKSKPISVIENGDITDDTSFNWGQPIIKFDPIDTSDFKISVDPCSDDDDDNFGLEMKKKIEKTEPETKIDNEVTLDIMAQQLKFIACLKILMEELSTLATGFEVDGGHLRFHLYMWLEKSVQTLKLICSYRTFSMRCIGDEKSSIQPNLDNLNQLSPSERLTPRGSHSDVYADYKPSLHEVLLADKMDFEAKLDRASRRKLWLTENEAFLRTLLSYCSLHGAHGGGLASVRMELILLLQELQQERSQQQLLSPLPFPTTLPLLAASVACQKTVIADPIRHLQSGTHDILHTILQITSPPLNITTNYSLIYVLRDLGISLSSCIYQSLCDSDTIISKYGSTAKDDMSSSIVYQKTHLLAGHQTIRRTPSNTPETKTTAPTTAPNKWPGVQSLRALLARDKDEDSPKLHTLLCEAFVAVYLSQLLFSFAACDAYVIYRLIGMNFNEQSWSQLFGGGAKKLIHVSTAVNSSQQSQNLNAQQSTHSNEEPEKSLDLFNTLSKQRMKLHMKILQQLNQSEKPAPIAPQNIKEDRPTYREMFIPPQTSIITYLMTKPILPDELILLDYDSSESIASEDDEFDNIDMEDITNDSVFAEHGNEANVAAVDKNMEREHYAWSIIRFAVIKLIKNHLLHFLTVAGIELQDLPTTSPLIHAIFKVIHNWQTFMNKYMNELNGPPTPFLPNSFVETGRVSGPAIIKYKTLLEMTNTPFRHQNSIKKASKRLWNYLVRQELVQDLFIRYIFGKLKANNKMNISDVDGAGNESSESSNPEPIRIIHKDQDNISAFCINRSNPGIIALSTSKEIQELDISLLLEAVPFLEEEAEYDILSLKKCAENLPSLDYLLVQHPSDRLQSSPGGLAIQSSVTANSTNLSGNAAQSGKNSIMAKHHFPGNTSPQFCQYIIERSRHILNPLKRHKTENVRRLCSHPILPLYLSGSHDGSVILWEWNHQQPITSPRPAGTFAKVTRVGFNQQGNKFGVTDGDGNLSLWQVSLSSAENKPFFSMQCHSKYASDFTFMGASSLVITAGQSSDHKNVALWDTLLPPKKCLITSFACHEHNGASAVLYAPLNQLLITGGKKGDVFIFDMRQRIQRDKFHAHESAVKCMALDPAEDFFVTGSADGDIKVWGLGAVRVLFYSFLGEHSRSTLFRNIGMGVSHLYIDQNGRLFSCGADGSFKFRQLPDRGINHIVTTL